MFRLDWNTMWTRPEAESTKIHPPLYLVLVGPLPLDSKVRPRVLHMKWSVETCCPGRSWSAEMIPLRSLMTEVVLPGVALLHCFPN